MTVKIKQQKSRGFTLIETLVAVIILATAIAAPLSIASKSLNSAVLSKQQVGAYFLAQDAVEYVRFVRDSNSLVGANWLTGAGSSNGINLSSCNSGFGCYINTSMLIGGVFATATPTICNDPGCPALNYDNTSYRYTYESGNGIVATPYTRTIKLTTIATPASPPTDPFTDSTEQRLTVTVSWVDPGLKTHTVSVYENLLKWQ